MPLHGSIFTTLFLLSSNPVPLILTLDHFKGKFSKLPTDLFLPISYLRLPPTVRGVLRSLLLFFSPPTSSFVSLVFLLPDFRDDDFLRFASGLQKFWMLSISRLTFSWLRSSSLSPLPADVIINDMSVFKFIFCSLTFSTYSHRTINRNITQFVVQSSTERRRRGRLYGCNIHQVHVYLFNYLNARFCVYSLLRGLRVYLLNGRPFKTCLISFYELFRVRTRGCKPPSFPSYLSVTFCLVFYSFDTALIK